MPSGNNLNPCQHNKNFGLRESWKKGTKENMGDTGNVALTDSISIKRPNIKELKRAELSLEKQRRQENRLALKQDRDIIRRKRKERKFKHVQCSNSHDDDVYQQFDIEEDDEVETENIDLSDNTDETILEFDPTVEGDWEIIMSNPELTNEPNEPNEPNPTELPETLVVPKSEQMFERVLKWLW